MRSKELRARRAQIIENARALLNGETVTDEQIAQFDAMMAEADTLQGQIDRIERSDAASADLAQQIAARGERAGIGADEQNDRDQRAARVFSAWLRGGIEGVAAADRDHAQAQIGRGSQVFQAAQATSPGAAGGYLVPPAYVEQLIIELKAYFQALNLFEEIRTDTGAPIQWPTNDDTSRRAKIIGENTQIGTGQMVFGTTALNAFLYATDAILVSWSLMQDSATDLDAFIRQRLAEAFSRTLADHLTTGTGNGMPQGLATAALSGVSGSGSAITYDNLVDLEHSIDPAYRTGAVYMFNDTTLREMRKLKDAQGRPLWNPSTTVGAPDTFAGSAYVINQSLPNIGAGASPVLYGNFSNYKFRIVRDVTIVRLNERYADYLQTGFFGYARFGGGLPSRTSSIKALTFPAAANGGG